MHGVCSCCGGDDAPLHSSRIIVSNVSNASSSSASYRRAPVLSVHYHSLIHARPRKDALACAGPRPWLRGTGSRARYALGALRLRACAAGTRASRLPCAGGTRGSRASVWLRGAVARLALCAAGAAGAAALSLRRACGSLSSRAALVSWRSLGLIASDRWAGDWTMRQTRQASVSAAKSAIDLELLAQRERDARDCARSPCLLVPMRSSRSTRAGPRTSSGRAAQRL